MRKLAANYLVSESGIFLKNAILVADEDGTVLQVIDTQGDLREIAQLTFHNGILIWGYAFVKTKAQIPVSESQQLIQSVILRSVKGQNQVSVQNLIDMGKRVQVHFPEMKIPEILNELSEVLLSKGGFSNEKIPGIFLLTGTDLVGLHFTPTARLKKIV
ncbi:MAG: hypothetical protein Q8N05_03890 [Bacteroidota bacterium]|nr:hypothetical protein [Bacteroidota bacterium]